MKRSMPLWAVYVADVLLFCLCMCVFAYFHHVRSFLGQDQPGSDADLPSFTKPTVTVTTVSTTAATSTTSVSGSTAVTSATTSTAAMQEEPGDFGEALGAYFRAETYGVVRHSVDDTIRTFLMQRGLPVSVTHGGQYIGLYQSHDLFITVEKVTDRIVYEGNGRESPEVYYLYDICVRNIENFYTSTVTKRKDMSVLVGLSSPIAAINGDYYGNAKRCMMAVRNGRLMRSSRTILGDLGILGYDGVLRTVSAGEYDYDEVIASSPYQVWCFGPSLLDEDGRTRPESAYDPSAYDSNLLLNRHPRTAIGYYEPGHYCFLVVDGRTDNSYGMRMVQLGRIFEALGCTAAYNLDGGDSSQAYYDGLYIRQAEGRDAQRELYDILCIGEIEK